ncbi:TetR/AcrR family transcriptional regulator [Microlunatus flavus]|uniref:DNA-binding transcriptional regulator, AcrR family n=1 Tax=Microlunatus flavus TaxID=1036181 RepID=A0A1H9CIQ3_9ACTN|nr:TetR/AcrR family transcriptional regulator [Microlunatus flavus]SEQ01110.1 DNA-binding transcriptional regulator, AcrR family [Microlunatus flavus]
MGRWEPDARGRLERAALELFVEQGFSATTVPQITARAGLTTRTFFRHFADKREVLYAGDEVAARARRLLEEAPPGLDAVAVVEQGLQRVAAERFDGRRDEVRQRRDLVRAEATLRERDAQKRADLVGVIRPALEARGTDAVEAALVAELAVVVLHVALDAWLDAPDERPLGAYMTDCFRRLRGVLDDPADGSAGPRVQEQAARF